VRADRKSTGEPKTSRQWHPQGVITLEVILVIPLLVIEFFAIFEFGTIAIVFNAANAAVVAGAYEGSLVYPNTFTDDDIADAIRDRMDDFLNVVGIEIADGGSASLADARIEIKRGGTLSKVRGTTDAGVIANCIQIGDSPAIDECVVTLCFRLNQTTPSGKPIPNWLSMFGFSISNTYFNATSRALLQ